MVLFIMLYKVAIIFESVDEILNLDNSDETYRVAHFVILMFFKVAQLNF